MSRPRAAPFSNGARARRCRACRFCRIARPRCARLDSIRITLLLLACLFFCGAAQAGGGRKYFEIVREKKPCAGKECFVEYVMLSNGLAVKKQIDKPEEDAPATLSIARVAAPDPLFARVTSFFKGASSAASRTTDSDNVFFYDGEKFYSYGASDPDAPAYLNLFQSVDAAFALSDSAPDFYVHVYYTPAKGNTKDFHVFSDGTVIASMFGKDTYMIIYTFVSATDAVEVSMLRQLGADAVKSPSSEYKKCAPAAGINYGFVEMKVDGGYIRSYTCGDEGDGVATLLNHIRTGFDGLKPQ